MCAQFSETNFLMCRMEDGVLRYAPLCIHSFRLIAPRRLLDAQMFNRQYHSYEEIRNVPDRLRWCRHHMGLMQKEVAERIGISRGMYMDFEAGYVDYYPKEIVDRLAALYQVSPTDFLDAYNLFLYNGQGRQIREYRMRLGMNKKPFADMLHVDVSSLRTWESDRKRMTKHTWERCFKDRV